MKVTLLGMGQNIRMYAVQPLGAGRGVIFRDVLSSGVVIPAAGVIGEGLAIPALRATGTVQAGIRPAGVSAHVTAAAIWIAVALLACFLPANRAARVDRVDALRQD